MSCPSSHVFGNCTKLELSAPGVGYYFVLLLRSRRYVGDIKFDATRLVIDKDHKTSVCGIRAV